ncbi:hypothetical protein [Aquabacterium sp.]|uniref:hypothetical protein n=1 Tax=Aquabacterium sp. TaxID=1872578 RepID=UPI00263527A5|nr:hypothetical protein [Aquabacterium sp.]MDD2978132.1 hypothetical protein [Aquabacterium sp.]
MAKITRKTASLPQYGGSVPYGNLTALYYQVSTNTSGAVIESDSTAAVASGDVIDLGPIPAGMRLDDVLMTISTGMTASVTGKLGFVYSDGVDRTDVPQNDAFFGAAYALATAAVLRKTATTAPVVLPKEARLVLTTGGAANAKASRIDVRIAGELTGPR